MPNSHKCTAGALCSAACGFVLALTATVPAHAALTISADATSNVTCTNGVCTASAVVATLNVGDLQTLLGKRSVKIVPGSLAQDIVLAAPLGWANSNRLTLDSYRSIAVLQPVSVTGTGALTVKTNDGGAGGTFSFAKQGSVHFWDLNSSLIINGKTYILVNSVAGVANAVVVNPAGSFALAANYDASIDGTYRKAPVAELDGAFEGLGNTISGLKVAAKAGHTTASGWDGQAGLFAVVAATGSIENVGVIKTKVSDGDLTNVGILVGELSGSVFNSYTTGTATTGNAIGTAGNTGVEAPDAGGLVGAMFASASVQNSYSTASVTGGGSSIVGGLVGGAYRNTQISNSHATGTVLAGDNILGGGHGSAAGGLLGLADDVSNPSTAPNLSGDYATGAVTVGTNGENFAGGLVGITDGAATIDLSWAGGSVSIGAANTTSAAGLAGGLVGGVVANTDSATGTVKRSYATGSVSGAPNDFLGGIVGYDQGAISDTYATGGLSSSGGFSALGGIAGYVEHGGTLATSYSTGAVQPVGGSWLGGAIGGLAGTATNVDWDTDTSGISSSSQGCGNTPNCAGVAGLSTAQLQSGLPGGFSSKTWREKASVNGGLPYLAALPPN